LQHYASGFPAVELNNTFYRRPTADAVARWLAATPSDFRFAARAQRSIAAGLATGRPADLAWVTDPYRAFGERLGVMLVSVPAPIQRSDERLADLLDGWPADLPLALELGDASWHVDETFALLAAHGATLCVTERPEDDEPPFVRRTARSLYLRLRRHDYEAVEIDAWAARIAPFLEDGADVFAFFRHDETGRAPELATMLAETVSRTRREATALASAADMTPGHTV
jgi:uncharacterized protein YecE (DUF72 family)